eukprot:10114264-Alexandrium_andersonii.AAC.1
MACPDMERPCAPISTRSDMLCMATHATCNLRPSTQSHAATTRQGKTVGLRLLKPSQEGLSFESIASVAA